ncbi:hypothetical protein ACFXOI_32325 [Streptomyces bacillaris]|uniref:hypothetical protein n=1 Tax=Streptomyces bacillaris TaxID=68179 RepID=UPI0036B9CBF2
MGNASIPSGGEPEDRTEPEESGTERSASTTGPGHGGRFASNVVAGFGNAVGVAIAGTTMAFLVSAAGIVETQNGPHHEGGAASVTRCV